MRVEVSLGEVVDKVTILEIKSEKVKNEEKLVNVRKEYHLLTGELSRIGYTSADTNYQKLKEINLKLWNIEDDIRVKELKGEFDDEFIRLARAVYFINDDRATVKKEINLAHGSQLIEEKEYVNYKGTPE